MRVFVTGASGAIGRRIVPLLTQDGHEVIGTHHSPAGAEVLRAAGATPVQVDLLDARAVRTVVVEHAPAAIVHQATALADIKFGRNLDRMLAATNRLRTEGTDALIAAARAAGVSRLIAQSGAAYGRYARRGGAVKTEDDPLDPDPPRHMRATGAALNHLEAAVGEFGGVSLRYGVFYGAQNDATIEPVRKRQFPIVGDGGGVWSWIHLDDAATATVAALGLDGPAILNVVDDDPAPVRDWLPVLAESLGADPPRRVPTWIARAMAGEAVTMMSTEARGASNRRARSELGWQPRFASWRQGFPATYGALRRAGGAAPQPAARPHRSTG